MQTRVYIVWGDEKELFEETVDGKKGKAADRLAADDGVHRPFRAPFVKPI